MQSVARCQSSIIQWQKLNTRKKAGATSPTDMRRHSAGCRCDAKQHLARKTKPTSAHQAQPHAKNWRPIPSNPLSPPQRPRAFASGYAAWPRTGLQHMSSGCAQSPAKVNICWLREKQGNPKGQKGNKRQLWLSSLKCPSSRADCGKKLNIARGTHPRTRLPSSMPPGLA